MPRTHLSRVVACLALAVLSACSVRTAACGRKAGPKAEEVARAAATNASNPAEPLKWKIAFLGDSVTAGLGLLSEQAYPSLVQAEFASEGYHEVEAVNAGITGDTTAGAVRRLDQLLEPEVKILVIALGGNDALRGLTPAQTHDNLAKLIDSALSKGVAVLLVGMQAPPNLGEDYRTAFSDTFAQLARDYKDRIEYVPFLLEGVAGHTDLNQEDGIHPNEAGAKIVAQTLYPKLRILVDQLTTTGGGL